MQVPIRTLQQHKRAPIQTLDANTGVLQSSTPRHSLSTRFLFQVTKDDVPVILVGGGSVLIDDKTNLRGASIVFKPANYDVRRKHFFDQRTHYSILTTRLT